MQRGGGDRHVLIFITPPLNTMDTKFFIGTSLDTVLDDVTNTIRVYIHDLAPFATGELDSEESLTIAVENLEAGSSKVDEMDLSDFVYADYLGSILGITRPNVHKEERLGIISLGGEAKFYWFIIGRNQERRMAEVFRLFVANKDNPEDFLEEANAYILEYNSKVNEKKFLIRTNKNMGEDFAYDIFVDIEEGQITIQDDTDNTLKLDSKSETWILKNKNGDQLTLTPDLIQLDTAKFVVNATEMMEVNTKSTTFNTSSSFEVNTGQSTFNSPTITLNGNTTNTGTMVISGATTAAGITASGVLGGGIDLETHEHPGDGGSGSGPTTGPPK